MEPEHYAEFVRQEQLRSGGLLLPLSNGMVALIDEDDAEKVSSYRWHADVRRTAIYARANDWRAGRMASIRLHRLLAGTPRGMDTDHVNGNGLDNRKSNLRICNRVDNCRNMHSIVGKTSQCKGVCWDNSQQRWLATITVDKKLLNLGRYDNEQDAAKKYDEAARQYFGEYARTNLSLGLIEEG